MNPEPQCNRCGKWEQRGWPFEQELHWQSQKVERVKSLHLPPAQGRFRMRRHRQYEFLQTTLLRIGMGGMGLRPAFIWVVGFDDVAVAIVGHQPNQAIGPQSDAVELSDVSRNLKTGRHQSAPGKQGDPGVAVLIHVVDVVFAQKTFEFFFVLREFCGERVLVIFERKQEEI